MQSNLARDVAKRMEKINSLLEDGPSDEKGCGGSSTSPSSDPEVDYWRKKLEVLSEPVSGSDQSNPLPKPMSMQPASAVAEAKLSWEGTSSFSDDHSRIPQGRSSPPPPIARSRERESKHSPGGIEGQSHAPSKQSAPPHALADLSPSAKISQPAPLSISHENPTSGGDAEVAYWRRKIAELSAVGTSEGNGAGGSLSEGGGGGGVGDIDGCGGGYHSTRLPSNLSPSFPRGAGQPMPQRLNLSNPRYKTRSLADEPLSWEGTASFADENKEPVSETRGTAPTKAEGRSEEKGGGLADEEEDIILAVRPGGGLRVQEEK